MEVFMIKKILVAVVVFMMTMGVALAAIEVNKTDQAGLDGIRGIGPSLSKAILAERSKNGEFKDWADLQKRVKGISAKNSVKFSQQGLVVNGQSKEGAAATSTDAAKKTKTASGN